MWDEPLLIPLSSLCAITGDSAANLTISSPLEAHKSHTLHFSVVGVDVGFENPVFACIEADYESKELEETKETKENVRAVVKNLTFYELDLGLNHVTRKWSERTGASFRALFCMRFALGTLGLSFSHADDGANLLIPVPGGDDGPGGVIVCCENKVIYKNQDHRAVVVSACRERLGCRASLACVLSSVVRSHRLRCPGGWACLTIATC